MGLIVIMLPISRLVVLAAAIIKVVSGNIAPSFAIGIAMVIVIRAIRIRRIRIGVRIRRIGIRVAV